MPAQLIRMSSAPKVSTALLDGAPAIRALRHVGAQLEEFSGEDRFGAQPIETGRIDVDARHLGACGGERTRHHPAHAAGRAGDDRDAARKQLLFCHDVPPAPTMANRGRGRN